MALEAASFEQKADSFIKGCSNENIAIMYMTCFLAGAFAVAYSLRFVHDTFLGNGPRDLDHTPHEPARWMKIPVEILVIVAVAFDQLSRRRR